MYFYGLDINIKSKSLANKNTGWVKLSENGDLYCSPDFDKPGVSKPVKGKRHEGKAGFNIMKLAEVIVNDLLAGHKVALGFEAPMWYPVPNVDKEGRFQMTARFQQEEDKVQKLDKNGNPKTYEHKNGQKYPVPDSAKHWYIGGSQPMVKAYPLGLLLFEWMMKEYVNKKTGPKPLTIKATTDFKEWVESDEPQMYLYEGFVTGLYKPERDDFKAIKKNGVLSNNEVVDAFIVANAARVFVKDVVQSALKFPKNDASLSNYSLPLVSHLRVFVDAQTVQVNSYVTNFNDNPRTAIPKLYIRSEEKGLKAPSRFMSVWEHVIRDANDNCGGQVMIELTGKKACDVYGFKFRNNHRDSVSLNTP